ncbi:hypothetical protein ACIBH1_05965 [Nonomuraea sp. NPDC050663]|uniref:hypothetical protein n=1 Tax=Nonomuraea sp. NPDC050663 TaxID=3364370 RepID=UPI0037974052
MAGIALVREPGPRIAEGIVTHLEREPVDAGLAAEQHRAYVRALEPWPGWAWTPRRSRNRARTWCRWAAARC